MIQTVYTGKNHSISDIDLVEVPDGKMLSFGKVVQRWLIRPVICGNRSIYLTAVMIKDQMTYNKSDSLKNLL
jgi:hypothetical protein